MNAILIVFMPTSSSRFAQQQPVTNTFSAELPPRLDDTAGDDRSTPPFWTWFIENPRSCRR
jgi:hypothetical protein